MQYSYSFLILLLPFLSFLLLGLLGMKMKKPVAGMIGVHEPVHRLRIFLRRGA